MGQAKWVRLTPAVLTALAPMPGGHLLMATAAKKHLTVFTRSRRAPRAGRPDVKAAFTRAARKTLGIADRNERNAIVAREVKAAGLKTGIYRRKSRARPGSPLYGHIYETGRRVPPAPPPTPPR